MQQDATKATSMTSTCFFPWNAVAGIDGKASKWHARACIVQLQPTLTSNGVAPVIMKLEASSPMCLYAVLGAAPPKSYIHQVSEQQQQQPVDRQDARWAVG